MRTTAVTMTQIPTKKREPTVEPMMTARGTLEHCVRSVQVPLSSCFCRAGRLVARSLLSKYFHTVLVDWVLLTWISSVPLTARLCLG